MVGVCVCVCVSVCVCRLQSGVYVVDATARYEERKRKYETKNTIEKKHVVANIKENKQKNNNKIINNNNNE